MENQKAPILIMLVGLPGSGKSTWINKDLSEFENLFGEFAVISTDNYIEEKAKQEGKTYSEVFTKYIDEATREMNVTIAKAIRENKNIIWDQTNTTVKSRKGKLSKIPNSYNKIAVVFHVPMETLKKRLEKRAAETGKIIPDHVMKSMNDSFEIPTKDEGFDDIMRLMA